MRIKLHGKEIIHEYYERRYERTNTKHEKLDKYCMTRSRVGTHTKKEKKKACLFSYYQVRYETSENQN